MSIGFAHGYPFDPSYGYSMEDLLHTKAPVIPTLFSKFWQARYARSLHVHPNPHLTHTGTSQQGYEVYDLSYCSTDQVIIHGWMLIPQHCPVTRVVVFGHGYGGCEGADYRLQPHGAALMFPCFRGLSLSQHPSIPSIPYDHVLHQIESPDSYVIGGCVDDIWLAVSAAEVLFPVATGRIGYSGISFGGGLGALALPWDNRIQRAHLNVPTFGHQPLRLQLPTTGSGAAIQRYQQQHGDVLQTLQYFDAATAAHWIHQPVHFAGALFDPAVAPPGQFAIYNTLQGDKSLFLLEAGHFEYPNRLHQEAALLYELSIFFDQL